MVISKHSWDLQNSLQKGYIHFTGFMPHTDMNLTTLLRISDTYDAKIAKIGNFWTFWPVILSKSRKGPFAQCSIDVKMQ